MATQDPRSPDDGGESSPTSNPANMHFFRPNDGIYVSEGPEQRTICVSPHLPPAMARNGDWHVEQFELHKELYRGKTSLLYMATDRISSMQVALKLYRKRKLSVLNRYQVEREVRLHINLHHENIIHLFAAFEDEKHVYMVQEFAVCGDLFEDLKKGGGQLKEKTAVRDVIVPFLSALAYLHNQGIIHRDIKPENILLGANKVIKVADFGLSININHERPVTRAGTLDYMAPEVLVCPDKRRPDENKDKILLGYTAQVDSWAVGILAYELLVGYPPFEQESRAATYEHIMYKEAKFPSWMTEDAKKFIGLALCKNATQRPTVVDLMQHTWVQPYIMRHLLPAAAASASPGPSRLRHSVSHAAGEDMGNGTLSTSSNGMGPAPPASTSSSGMSPAPPSMQAGQGGRMFMSVAPPPHPHTASSAALPNSGAPQQQSQSQLMMDVGNGNGSFGHGSSTQQQKGGQGHAAQQQMHLQLQQMQQHVSPQAVPTPPPSQRPATLKTSISLQAAAAAGANEPITGVNGEGGRLHDSISDPTARAFEMCQNPHPPGASAAASLFGPHGSRSGGAGAEMDRQASQSQGISSSGAVANGGVGNGNGAGCNSTNSTSASGGVVPRTAPSAMNGTSAGSLTARLAHANTHVPYVGYNSLPMHGSRPVPPPLVLDPTTLEGVGSITSVNDTGSLIAASGGGGGALPYHVADTIMPLSPSSHPRSATAMFTRPSLGPGQGQGSPMPPGSAPPRQRMVPPVNVSSSFMGHLRMPAPPISPKPHTPDLPAAFHRPASGVLSDDSFMVPARTPSISLGMQLSPLQAQLLAPRPSSRLNSPSHSRRNSISQAGQAPPPLGATTAMQQQQLYMSTPLPQLGGEYGEGVFPEDPSVVRASNNYRTGPAPLSVNVSSKAFGKVWGSREGGNGNSDAAMDGLSSGGTSFSSRGGGGGGGGNPVSPLVRSSAAARVRMLTPDEPRPLMRESSVSMSFKSSGGGGGNGLHRDDIGQQSMTVYHRPGKVGMGRAALAARDADGADSGASGAGSPLGHLHMNSSALTKTKSLVARNYNNGVMVEDGASLARVGSDMVLARTAAGMAAGSQTGMATQRSFTGGNSAIARKLAHGAIATKVTEYVKGRMPHDDDAVE